METSQKTVQQLLEETDQIIAEGRELLLKEGRSFNPNHWIILEKYAKKYELESIVVVMDWISRGVVPAEDVTYLEDLCGITLIKDKSYENSPPDHIRE